MSEIITLKPNPPTIAACMIVKNEEDMLGACLHSITPLVDDLVVVDTGSDDATVEIAEEYGARVFHFPWTGDFSEARNVALDKSESDYILIMDADEELEQVDIPPIKEAAKSGVEGFIFQIHNLMSGGVALQVQERLFKTGMGHYEGIKHNQLMGSRSRTMIPARISHYGYNLTPKKQKAKNLRDKGLLETQIEAEPDNTFHWRNYLRTLLSSMLYDDVIAHGVAIRERILSESLVVTDGSYRLICTDLANAYASQGETEKAIEVLAPLVRDNPSYIDGHFYLADCYFTNAQYQESLNEYVAYIQSLAYAKANYATITSLIETWGSTWRAYSNMAECYVELKQYDQALNALKITSLQSYEGMLDRQMRISRRIMQRR